MTYFSKKPLTELMKKALRQIVRDKSCAINAATINGLVTRGLAQKDGLLTSRGYEAAIELLPLKEQCDHLGIQLELKGRVNSNLKPESEAFNYYQQQGYSGTYCEGAPLRFLVEAAAFNIRYEMAKKEKETKENNFPTTNKHIEDKLIESLRDMGEDLDFSTIPEDIKYEITKEQAEVLSNRLECMFDASCFTPIDIIHISEAAQMQPQNPNINAIFHGIEKASRDDVIKGIEEVYEVYFKSDDLLYSLYLKETYPGLSADILIDIYDAIGNDLLVKLARNEILRGNASFIGWPDLTLVKDGEIQWVEIKTTDRLHNSQICMIRDNSTILKEKVKILQLKEDH